MFMTDEQAKINAAFERFLESSLSKDAERKIADCYGEEIAARVGAIYKNPLNVPVDWRAATIDLALPVLHDFLRREYPWLSDQSRSNIDYAFVMSWK